MGRPYFTICIPVYNRESTIVRTLESIKIQKFTSYEVIIVNDGSTDNTLEVINSWTDENMFEAKVVNKENGGKHTALNVGIQSADGKFFLILDSDDWLREDALENMHDMCIQIEDKAEYSGIMGRCIDCYTGEIIGDLFPSEPLTISYVDFHFILSKRLFLGDCCECNKTDIMKQYRFPEPPQTKFVPEAWLFDQIGVKYKLLCTNKTFEIKEYRSDGISSDVEYKNKNYIGFLYHYISRLENVIPNADLSFSVKVIAWWRYWQMVKLDKDTIGPRCKNVTILGKIIKIIEPLITFVFKARYRKLYEAGR